MASHEATAAYARKANTLDFQLRWAKDRERELRRYRGTPEEIATQEGTVARLEAAIATLTTKRNELEDEAIATPCGRSRDDRERQVGVMNRQLLGLYGRLAEVELAGEVAG